MSPSSEECGPAQGHTQEVPHRVDAPSFSRGPQGLSSHSRGAALSPCWLLPWTSEVFFCLQTLSSKQAPELKICHQGWMGVS